MTCKYCKENVLRKDLERHEGDDCSQVPATCDFCAIGCNHDKVRDCLLINLERLVWERRCAVES